ncbi:hypothetical protein [Nocardia sp. NBC_01327]|uniref:hypothetical protein n=1 Tax=Nocardia sp. NBC_01327 TaxID=2903593 RepID=UPI002E14A5F0|nr:hypothetical protein OG326_00470 [Nocardia sp. NBC_01327]
MTDPNLNWPGNGVPQAGPPAGGPGGPYGPPGAMPVVQPGLPAAQPVWNPPVGAQHGGFLVAIGDIAVMEGAVVTPSGTLPLRGATWTATDMSQTTERIPAYAVVLAILFFPVCFIGLFFLLIKERVIAGYVQVTVNNAGRFHSTMIQVQDQQTFPMVMHQINYARQVSAM